MSDNSNNQGSICLVDSTPVCLWFKIWVIDMPFLRNLVNISIGSIYGMHASYSTIQAHGTSLKALYSAEPISIAEFESLYDMRRYDVYSRQNDIIILKEWDEPGAYVLTNTDRNKNFVGRGSRVFRKAFRQIHGHDNPLVYHELLDGDNFEITIFLLSRSNFDKLDDLVKAVVATCGHDY